ncbi:hypothetical protein BD779DRAFT_1729479 [Infundibulicybe gibba]|nr:hypothetical protein BD779DRAFT_1729479 [Infundibulicybe gibba]
MLWRGQQGIARLLKVHLKVSWEYQHRYEGASAFEHGTIQNFASNFLEMKKLAARGFEDPLQLSFHMRQLREIEDERNSKLSRQDPLRAQHLPRLDHREPDPRYSRHQAAVHIYSTPSSWLQPQHQNRLAYTQTQIEQAHRQLLQRQLPQSLQASSRSIRMLQPNLPQSLSDLATVRTHFLGDNTQHIRSLGATDSFNSNVGTNIPPPITGSLHTDSWSVYMAS